MLVSLILLSFECYPRQDVFGLKPIHLSLGQPLALSVILIIKVKAPTFVGLVPYMFVLLRSNYRETSRHQYQTDLGNSRAMRVVDD